VKVSQTALPGVLVVEPVVHADPRGYFLETFADRVYRDALGIDVSFVQDNSSRSTRGVLRGLHFQLPHAQGKLVRVSMGAVFDVIADVDAKSPTFKRWVGIELSERDHRQVWIPPGYAHGFLVLTDVADFQYKCTEYYCREAECGVRWDDEDLAIDWPAVTPIVSEKDASLPRLRDLKLAAS
jgi:dTDP-4-dehydrorhamnose 3,5-epimerase